MSTIDKTVKEATVGGALLRIVRRGPSFAGAIIRDGKIAKTLAGDNSDHLWMQMLDEVAASDPRYFGFDGAKNRFLGLMTDGFKDASYHRMERAYKDEARRRLNEQAPLAEVASGKGVGEAVLSVYRKTNLLHPVEQSRVQEVLRGPNSDAFVKAAARFTLAPGAQPLRDMQSILAQHGAASWTIATYLPFFWKPETHMFLKPEVTREFAARVGHRFDNDYEAALEFGVYESLLDLAEKTAIAIADLKPVDRIDIQSFIWVVGRYCDDDKA